MREHIIVPFSRHFGNLNFTYYGGLRQPEFVSSGGAGVHEGARVLVLNSGTLLNVYSGTHPESMRDRESTRDF